MVVVVFVVQIDDFVADTIIAQLLLLDATDSKRDIRLLVNCSGGSLNAAMAIYDAIQLVRADVSTIALGIAASTAAIVLAGQPSRRPRHAPSRPDTGWLARGLLRGVQAYPPAMHLP